MAQSVHKVLIHGYDIIQRQTLPIGLMSEETQEARNEDLNYHRENFSRKTSRTATNTDLINRLLVSSGPVISSLRKLTSRRTNHKTFSSDVLQIKLSSPQYYCFINCCCNFKLSMFSFTIFVFYYC